MHSGSLWLEKIAKAHFSAQDKSYLRLRNILSVRTLVETTISGQGVGSISLSGATKY